MNESHEQIAELIRRLAAIPARIARCVADWSIEQLQTALAPDEWAARDILAHLRAADDIVAPRISMILVRDNPPLPAYDERRWAEIIGYRSLDFTFSLTAFTLRRAEVVRVLENIAYEQWGRAGTHEVQGPLSLFEIVQGVVGHEEEHCLQLEVIAASSL